MRLRVTAGVGHTLTMRMAGILISSDDVTAPTASTHSVIDGCFPLPPNPPDAQYGPKWAYDNNSIVDGCNTFWGGRPSVLNQKFGCNAVWSPGAGELIGKFLVTMGDNSCPYSSYNPGPTGNEGSFDLWVSE